MLVAYTQQPASEPTPDDTFRDVLDVAGVAIPLALVVLVIAASWPNLRRWARHRLRRRRRRRQQHANTPRLP